MLGDTSRTAPGCILSRRTPSSSSSAGVLLIRTFTFTQCVAAGDTNPAPRALVAAVSNTGTDCAVVGLGGYCRDAADMDPGRRGNRAGDLSRGAAAMGGSSTTGIRGTDPRAG